METAKLNFKRRVLHPESRLAYLLMLPAVLFLVIFMFYPILYVFEMSLFRTDKIGRLQEFVWLANYIDQIQNPEFWEVVGRSAIWTLIGVAAKTLLGMIIALALNIQYWGRKVVRMLFILPWASAVPISAMLWTWVLNHEFGLLNHTLKAVGVSSPPIWLGRPISSFVATMWVDVWIGVPFMALVFLAGMQSISEDLYESGYIDGVSAWQKFIYITLPGIRHLIIIATLLSALWTFNDFNTIYIMTRGGPAGATDILITGVYKSAFEWLKWSQASVMAVVTFIVLTAVSVSYARLYFKSED
jgi:multiple sugar transport system permease protein